MSHQGYGFVEFMGEEDADYSIRIMNMIKLYGKPIRVNKVGKLLKVTCTVVGEIVTICRSSIGSTILQSSGT